MDNSVFGPSASSSVYLIITLTQLSKLNYQIRLSLRPKAYLGVRFNFSYIFSFCPSILSKKVHEKLVLVHIFMVTRLTSIVLSLFIKKTHILLVISTSKYNDSASVSTFG